MRTTNSSQGGNMLVVCQHFWPETFRINDICYYFSEKGYKVDVLCGIPNYPKGDYFEGYSLFRNRKQNHHGINILRVFEIPRGKSTNFRIILNNISYPLASIFHLPKLLFKKYDKIFIYQLSPVMMSIPGIIIGKIRKTETTMWVIDLWPDNLFSFLNVKNKYLRSIATQISVWHYKNVDKIVVLSDTMKSRLIELAGVRPSQVIVLPQACEKLYEDNVYDKKLALRFKGKFNVLFTGTITPLLSFQTVVDAAKILYDKGLVKINWVIVGDGMSRGWLEEESRSQGLSEVFHFEGSKPKEEIPLYTTNVADILLSCLVNNKLLETTIPAKVTSYIAAGKPIVLAMNGEASELVNNVIKCGFAGPAEDATTLANNIEKIYNMSKAERNVLGNRARRYHFKHLERDLVLNKLKNYIEN